MFLNCVSRGPLRDPDPAPPAGGEPFDPAAFKTELLTEVRKELAGEVKGLKTFFTKLIPARVDPPAGGDPPPPAGDPPPPVGGKTPAENALALELKNYKKTSEDRINALEQINKETKQAAEKTDRESRIRSELAKYQFANDKARDTAFKLFATEVTRTEDGSLVANDLPFDKFIETELPAQHSYLLAPKDVGSAGARNGKNTGGKKWDLERDLKPEIYSKLTPAEQADLRLHIAGSA